jgi:hypothetical protein
MRRASGVLATCGLLGGALVGLPSASAAAATPAATVTSAGSTAGPTAVSTSVSTAVSTSGPPRVRSLPVARSAERGRLARTTARTVVPDDRVVAALAPREVPRFAMVGVTWSPTRGLDDVVVQVRTRTDDGWGAWQEVPQDEETVDAGRPGTEPMYVGESDAVAVQVASADGVVPRDLRLETLDLGTAPSAQTAPAAPVAEPLDDPSPTFTPKPAVVGRAAWGARAGTSCDAPRVGRTTFGVTLHHTAGSNSYTRAQSASIVRGIQAYHTGSRDWCDIGYNVLVDRYGQVFEGRKGGLDRTVRGAHAGNGTVNTYAMGVSMIGNYDTATVGAATRAALVRTIGWRLGTFYRGAKGTWSAAGKRYQVIHGHRDVVGTACPGRNGYAYLPTLRDEVAAYIADYDSEIKRYAAELGRDLTGYPYASEYGNATQRKTFFQDMELYWKQGLGVFWVGGRVRTEYNHLGAHAGVLGFPTSLHVRTDDPAVSLQRFEDGTVYRVVRGSSTIGLGIHGDIEDLYRELGESTGRLGAPETRVYRKPGLLRARFDGGIITQRDGRAPEVAYR